MLKRMNLIYVKTTMQVPGMQDVVHYAELEHLPGSPLCRPLRMLEASGSTITGAFRRDPALSVGMANEPQQIIPHPDSWGDMPDISSERMTVEAFEALWVSYLPDQQGT